MANPKNLPREVTTRENSARKGGWKPANLLPDPIEKEGWGHRYVRKSTHGNHDVTNMSKSLREGWEPCKIEDYPELKDSVDPDALSSGLVEIGGLILCRMPVESIAERDAYFRRSADAQVAAIDAQLMKDNDPRMPMFKEHKTQVFGHG